MDGAPGDRLEDTLASARHEVLLVAPFIKFATLQRLLVACLPGVPLKVVTRWRLEEIVGGVSDLDVWLLLRDRGAQLWLHPNLHAKYYRADDRVMVGSANLTSLGLGWRADANLEILIEPTQEASGLANFETELWARASKVDDTLYRQFKEAADAFEKATPAGQHTLDEGSAAGELFEAWRPMLRYPSDLILYYLGKTDELTAASRETAARDLAVLAPPSGLNERQLRAWIGTRLRIHPEMRAIHAASEQPRRFGHLRALLRSHGAEDPARAWQTWMRWISYLYPDEYEAGEANYSEIFRRTS
jgi:hypothetical protein